MSPIGCYGQRLGVLGLALMLGLFVACGGNSPESGNQAETEREQVRGAVLEVVGRNIVELESLRIRDETGKEWVFGARQGFIGFSPSHLREHQVAGESVLVTFVDLEGELVAVDITD